MDFVEVETVLRRAGALSPPPETTARLLNLLGGGDWDLERVTLAVAEDAGLAERLRERAGRRGARPGGASLAEVVRSLEPWEILRTASSRWLAGLYGPGLPAYGLGEGELWRHVWAVASAVEVFEEVLPMRPPVEAHVAALLHDIGMVVLGSEETPCLRGSTGQATRELESEHRGLDHAAVGHRVVSHWRLPARVATAIACHHGPEGAPDERSRTAASFVCLANEVAWAVEAGLAEREHHVPDGLRERLGATPEAFERICELTRARLAEGAGPGLSSDA